MTSAVNGAAVTVAAIVATALPTMPGAAGETVSAAEIRAGRGGERRIGQRARHVAMYLLAVDLELTQTSVGAAFGRDRTTVRHAVRRIEDRRDDPAFDEWLGHLERRILKSPQQAGHPADTG